MTIWQNQAKFADVFRGQTTMVKQTPLAAALAMLVGAAPCLATPINSKTSCSVAIQAFGSAKRAAETLAGVPSPQVTEVGGFIMTVMERLDRRQTEKGKPGIWSNLSDRERHILAASAVANCRLHPRRTIYQAADFVYHSERDIQIQMDLAK
jgi:hypothetical protein